MLIIYKLNNFATSKWPPCSVNVADT